MSQNEAAGAEASSPSAIPNEDDHGGESELNTIDMNLHLHSPAHQSHMQGSYRLHTPTHSVIDEDSNRFFMSEPSLSEDGGDASSGQVIRAPHRARLFGRHNSSDEDEQHPYRLRNHRQQSPYRSAPSSPGNTSLSSWDSPGPGKVKNLVHVHFVPPTLTGSDNQSVASSYNNNNNNNQRYLPPIPNSHNDAEDRNLPPLPLPPPPPAPTDDHPQHDTDVDSYFLRQLHYATSSNSSHSLQMQMPSNSINDGNRNLQDSFVLRDHFVSPYHHHQRHSSSGAADESIIMTLSDSDEDDAGDQDQNGADSNMHRERASNHQHHQQQHQHEASRARSSNALAKQRTSQRSARNLNAPQIKQQQQQQHHAHSNGKGHRRSRSGDAAAAKIATGRDEWKGMRSANLFLPTQEDDDGDDEEEDCPPQRKPEPIARRVSRGQPRSQSVPLSKLQTSLEPQLLAQQTAESTRLMDEAPSNNSGYYGGLSGERQGGSDSLVSSWPPKTNLLAPSLTKPSAPIMYPYGRRWSAGSVEGACSSKLPDTGTYTGDDADDYAFGFDVGNEQHEGNVHFTPHASQLRLPEAEPDVENPSYQEKLRYTRHSDSPFANIGKKSAEKAKRANFLPQSSTGDQEGKNYHFYVCPRCNTRQREFFTVDDAPRQLGGPSSYLALYFSIYVISSLFIFGLEEGWETGDCIYFAVVTLTTAGLGDFVPTSPANKIICSIFIYFGVACIGLLLGSYIAGMLDDKARHDRKDKLIDSCPYCARLQTIKEASCRSSRHYKSATPFNTQPARLLMYSSERFIDTRPDHTAVRMHEPKYRPVQKPRTTRVATSAPSIRFQPEDEDSYKALKTRSAECNESSGLEITPFDTAWGDSPASSASKSSFYSGSPVTRSILDRQEHTRHNSIDFTHSGIPASEASETPKIRRMSHDNIKTPTISETAPLDPSTMNEQGSGSSDEGDNSCCESDSVSTTDELVDEAATKVKAIQYVFLTLRQALLNSMTIIAVGCFGFWFIEGFSLIDSWYFTTVFLTTVGYGDIVPVTRGGKAFATTYILVAGTILLNNMSSISMIPIELRKRRIERAVLTQFGDELDDAALRELATGPLIQRLRLSANRPDGLDECTREMFSLAMLVRLGKVSETDIRETFAAFRRLDVNDEGILNSKSIIAAIIQKRRGMNASTSMTNLQEASRAQGAIVSRSHSTTADADDEHPVYWVGKEGSLHVDTPAGEYTFEDAEELRRRERTPLFSGSER